jgi:hypothetical protein
MSTRNESQPVPAVIHVTLIVLYLSLFSTPNLQAGGRRRAVAVPPPSALSLTFIESGRGGTAVLDAGTISWSGGRKRVSVTTRNFAVRIGPASREAHGTATLRAFLETPDPHATIRIDGIVLGSAPRVIQHHAPIGIAVTHRLEIEVPLNAPEGALNATIGWEVTQGQ